VFRYPHPDFFSSCDNPGIAIFTSRKVASDALRVRDAARNEYKLSLNSGLIDPVLALNEFVKAFNRCRGRRRLLPKEALLIDELFFRVFEGLSLQANNAVSIAEEFEYGTPPQAPRVSIVIPFFKAHELLRHQFADFARDDFIKQQDLILVYDSVEDEEDNPDRFNVRMHRVFELYHVPVKVLVTNRNCGFSMACNLGASAARAPYLLLLNSDVFPKSKNWLQALISDFEGDPAVGIVGARLFYPDESLQHAYLSWQHEVLRKNLVMITQPYKGMIPSLVPCKGAVEVDGVTGACMMFRTAEYRSLGMLDTGFIRGDFEDSEICLRFRASGKKIVSDNRVELYHLEGASWAMCSSDLRESLLCINAIRHQKRWGSLIDRIINAEPEEASHDLPKSYC
jgi:GT2 family glycosyltransferase